MLKIFNKFQPRANPADGNYPNGSIKNESVPGAKDGTPLDKDWGNDFLGFDEALLAEAGITPSGNPDTAVLSDRLEALKITANIAAQTPVTLASVVADAKLKINMVRIISDRADGPFDVILAGTTPDVDLPNTRNIVQCVGAPTLAVRLRQPNLDPIAWGATWDNVADDTLTVQAIIDFISEGDRLVLSGKGKFGAISVTKNIDVEFDNFEHEGLGIDTDSFIYTRGPKFFGRIKSSNHRMLCRVSTCVVNDDFIFDMAGSESTNCYGVCGGRPSSPINAGRLYLDGFQWSDCELAVYFREFLFSKVQYDGLIGDNMLLKPLTDRTGNLFGKFYTGGLFIDCQGRNTEIVAQGGIATNINYTAIDPFTLAPVVISDVEVHFFAVLTDGDGTMSNHVVRDLVSAQTTDNEGLLVRADRAIIESSIALDAGDNEGSMYTKGSTFSKMSDNIIAFTSTPVSNSVNRGAIVTSDFTEGYNNTFVNCGRGFSNRAKWAEFIGNHYITCVSPVFLALEAAGRLCLQSGETYDECDTTATLATTFVLDKYRLENPTIKLKDASTIGSWSDSNVTRYELQGGTVEGNNLSTKTGLLTLAASGSKSIVIKDLNVNDVKGNAITTSVIRVNSNLNNLTIKGVDGDDFNELIRLRDRTYANLVVMNNSGLDGTGATINKTAITVTGKNVILNNVGDDL